MKNKAFTLIELLVVVLIIGILAAVAVPKYQKSVEKSRLYSFIPLVKSVAVAKGEYYLATGQWARKFENLSISLSNEWSIADQDYYGQYATNSKQKTQINLDAGSHYVVGILTCFDRSQIWYYIPSGETKEKAFCFGVKNKRSSELCANSFGATFWKDGTSQGEDRIYYHIE